VTLRRATLADASEIGAIFAASRRLLSFLPELHTVEEDHAHVRDHILVASEVTLAQRDGRIAGFLARRGSEIDHLYVAADGLGRGIGSALIADAKSRHDRLELWCFADNLPARRFYEKHGFRAILSTDGADNEARMPDVRYRWPA
jgi:GNAT superfamily N-acetyltransferase